MSRQAYLDRMCDTDWAPGWDAILEAFAQVYDQPCEYLPASHIQGLHSSLEGFGLYHSPSQYLHIVTRGLSRIYPHPVAYGGRSSGWGFELTMKWPCAEWTACKDAFRLLDRLAEAVEVQKIGFAPIQRLWRRRDPLVEEPFQKYGAGTIVIPDTEVKPIETVHGELEFVQIVNISSNDAKRLSDVPIRVRALIRKMQEENVNIPFHVPVPHDYLVT